MLLSIAPWLVLAGVQSFPPDLGAYVAKKDSATAWTVASKEADFPAVIKLTSQSWKNGLWQHDIITSFPNPTRSNPEPKNPGVALIFVTGGKPNAADKAMTDALAQASGLPVFSLFQIPNQPIEGRNEDDLIAHTFQKYMETGDTEWPLLLPMTKSVTTAMDAIVDSTKSTPRPIRKFIVFGASKRGWTTWLAGATQDRRIVGIAPCVFDNLNFDAQLKHQLDSWGKYSEMIGDYTSRGLQEIMGTPNGKKLVSIVDPYTYRAVIRCPVLIVNGANDRYWTVDALSKYVHQLRMPLSVCVVPNAGHNLGDGQMTLRTLSAFAYAVASEKAFPSAKLSYDAAKDTATIYSSRMSTGVYDLWVAYSDSRDFRDSTWAPIPTADRSSARPTAQLAIPVQLKKQYTAMMGMTEYTIDGRNFQITTPVLVVNSQTKQP